MAETPISHRPVIFDYRAVPDYLKAMYHWRSQVQPRFSIRRETATMHRCSPALVTRVLQGKRRLTLDRVPDFARLFSLTAEESRYLRQWILAERRPGPAPRSSNRTALPKPKRAQNHLLSDWLNIYVKDLCRIRGFRPNPHVIYRMLGGLAPVQRIRRSLEFLFREGFLRKTLDGRIVENEVLVTTTDEELNAKLQSLHRQALEIARRGILLYPLERRRESLVVLPLNESSLKELKALLKEFYNRVLAFAEEHPHDDEALYQVVINLCPVGGNTHADEKVSN